MKPKHKIAYMKCAQAFAECSVSKRLKVGAVIVKDNNIIACGYNALPAFLDGPLEDENGNTSSEVRHAEKNALMQLTKGNTSSVGASIFITHSPCVLCSIDLIDAGIKSVYFLEVYRDTKGLQYLFSHGVKLEKYNFKNNSFFYFIPSLEPACSGGQGEDSQRPASARFDTSRLLCQ